MSIKSFRYLLRALDQLWHEDCLKCACCDCRLGEVGSTLFTKANLILCKRDYLRYVHPNTANDNLLIIITKVILQFESCFFFPNPRNPPLIHSLSPFYVPATEFLLSKPTITLPCNWSPDIEAILESFEWRNFTDSISFVLLLVGRHWTGRVIKV